MAQSRIDGAVLIAGGSSGIGKALARCLLEEDVRVIIAGRSASRLDAAADDLASDLLRTAEVDISNERAVRRLFEATTGIAHIVCTVADIRGAYRLLPDLPLDAIQRAIGSKLIGPMLLAKHGGTRLPPTGSLTYVSGIAAHRPAARGAAVAAINGGLESLVYALAIELAPVRVNAVSPGWVDSPIWRDVAGDEAPAMLAAMAKRLPAGRVGTTEDIADALRFVLGNGFVTGSVLHVDGGHRLI